MYLFDNFDSQYLIFYHPLHETSALFQPKTDFSGHAMNSLRVNIGLLATIASKTGHDYTDAYAVWELVYQDDDAYAIVDTVLWIAKRQRVHVLDALVLYRGIENLLG